MWNRLGYFLAIGVLFGTNSVTAQELFEQEPGTVISIDINALPQPYSPPSPANPPRTLPKPARALPTTLPGFSVNAFASSLKDARNLKVAPDGTVFLSEPRIGQITLLRDTDNDGRADVVTAFADGFRNPHGIAIGNGFILIGDLNGVWRLPYAEGDTKASVDPVQVTKRGALGDPGGHSTRNVVLHPDGSRFYVAIGSRGNIAEEPEPRATIQEFQIDGSVQRTFASGLRNPVGMAFYPGSSDLYTVVNERDGLHDELVPEYMTRVIDGGFYGWPYSYMGSNPQPNFADKRPDLVEATIVPDTLFRSHSAPIGLVFYTGTQFPAEYQGGAFVTLRGSWNAAQPRGYNVVYVPVEDGVSQNQYTVFASGLWAKGEDRAEVWGRPTGITMTPEGSLLFADDVSQTVWRVTYDGAAP
ncbi:MAG: PQQ-dependent sugar dehydrogenase [Rhodospirillaceae bacterium]